MSSLAPLAIGSPKDASPDWATAILRNAGHDVSVSSISVTGVGHGMIGDTFRFELELEPEGGTAPTSFVAKFPAEDPTSRATGFAYALYQRELGFYGELVATVGVRTAEPLYAHLDQAGESFTLVLEDLSPARGGDQLQGCSPDEAAIVIEQAALLHAPRWGDRTLESIPWLNVAQAINKGSIDVIRAVHGPFRERFTGLVEEHHLDVCDYIAANVEDYFARHDMTRTIQHADFRLDNILWDVKGGAEPMALVDWQTVQFGPGVLDVAYFLGAGLLPEQRRIHEHELVRLYYDKLVAGGVAGLSWEQCWDQYRLFTYAGLLMAIGPAMVVEQTERGDQMFAAMASRHAQHALDLNAAELLKD